MLVHRAPPPNTGRGGPGPGPGSGAGGDEGCILVKGRAYPYIRIRNIGRGFAHSPGWPSERVINGRKEARGVSTKLLTGRKSERRDVVAVSKRLECVYAFIVHRQPVRRALSVLL